MGTLAYDTAWNTCTHGASAIALSFKRQGSLAAGAAPPQPSTSGGSGGKMTVLGGEDFSMEKWREVDKKVGG